MISRESIAQVAQSRAASIIELARQEAEAMQVDADNYVMEVLGELESSLIRTLTVVRNGINSVSQRRDAHQSGGQEQAVLAETELRAVINQDISVSAGTGE